MVFRFSSGQIDVLKWGVAVTFSNLIHTTGKQALDEEQKVVYLLLFLR